MGGDETQVTIGREATGKSWFAIRAMTHPHCPEPEMDAETIKFMLKDYWGAKSGEAIVASIQPIENHLQKFPPPVTMKCRTLEGGE